MAKIIDIIKNAKHTLFSFEILPPLKGEDIRTLFSAIENLMEFNPPFIDVTYHREEYEYRIRENGLLEKVVVYKRPGTVAISAAIMQRFNVEAVPHILCGGFNREETENALLELDFLGIQNVLALRGDPIKSEGVFKPEKNGNAYASELVKQIKNLNKGFYLDEHLNNHKRTDFCVGVAGYPEKHHESPNLMVDLMNLKEKVNNGADYIVTQMFFDNKKYFDFVKKCREIDINVPIIPGLKPITNKNQLTLLPRIFHLDIPEELSLEVMRAKDKEAVKRIGIEWCIHQSLELKKAGVPVLHYYTMSKSDAIKEIASKVF